MKILNIALLVVLLISINAFSCDFDGDNISDPTTYNYNTMTWQYLSSNSNALVTVNSFGNTFGTTAPYLVPGQFLGSTMTDMPAFVNIDGELNIKISNTFTDINSPFTRADVSYMGSHDFDGDGYTDSLKLTNRCSNLNKNCYKQSGRFTFFINEIDSFTPNNPFSGSTGLNTSFIGSPLSALFVMDANNDGKDDICYAKPLAKKKKAKRKIFRAFCHDALTENFITKFKLGKIFNLPLSINFAGKDHAVLYKKRGKKNDTLVTLIDTSGNAVNHSINAIGDVVIGDYLGVGYQQVAVATNGVLTILDPITNNMSFLNIGLGTAIDCNNNHYGKVATTFVKTKNVCKVLTCK